MIYKLFILFVIIIVFYYTNKIENWGYLKLFKYPVIIFLLYSVMWASTLNFSRISIYKDDRNIVFYNDNSILIRDKGIRIENVEKVAKYSDQIYAVFNKDNEKYVLEYEDSYWFNIYKEKQKDTFYNYAKKENEFMNFKIFKLKYTERDRNENR